MQRGNINLSLRPQISTSRQQGGDHFRASSRCRIMQGGSTKLITRLHISTSRQQIRYCFKIFNNYSFMERSISILIISHQNQRLG